MSGVFVAVFKNQIYNLVTRYKSNRNKYATVVAQSPRTGIPMSWFTGTPPGGFGGANGGSSNAGGANAANSGQPNGGDTSGADTAGDAAGQTAGGAGQGLNDALGPNGGSGDNATAGKNGNGGAGGPNGGGNVAGLSGNAGNGGNTSGNNNRGGRRGGEGGSGDEDEDGLAGGAGRGSRGGAGNRGEGGTLTADERKRRDEARARGEIVKEDGEIKTPEEIDADNRRALYGTEVRKSKAVGCQDFDLTMLLKIGAVLAVFLLLASVLFQKRDNGE